ncbi:hypothetical protein ONZ45_g457 [Pleurotus djamor]|nr:hypothetical protein ONZ45_g457 [Pleurotus djamor]
MALLGKILYVTLLFINSMAVLSEERFLARIGWSSSQTRNAAYQQSYDSTGYGAPPEDIGIKARIVDLISAVRTLMRRINILIIIYEIIFP